MMFKVQLEHNDSRPSRPDDAVIFKFAKPKIQSMSVSSREVSFVRKPPSAIFAVNLQIDLLVNLLRNQKLTYVNFTCKFTGKCPFTCKFPMKITCKFNREIALPCFRTFGMD